METQGDQQLIRCRALLRQQKAYRAAVIYYNEVIRSSGIGRSEKRKNGSINCGKLGDKVLQPLQEAEAEKRNAEQEKAKRAGQSAPGPNSAPILPPDLDSSFRRRLRHAGHNFGSASSSEPARSATPEPSSTSQEGARLRDLKIPVLLKPRLRRRREEFDCGGVSLPPV